MKKRDLVRLLNCVLCTSMKDIWYIDLASDVEEEDTLDIGWRYDEDRNDRIFLPYKSEIEIAFIVVSYCYHEIKYYNRREILMGNLQDCVVSLSTFIGAIVNDFEYIELYEEKEEIMLYWIDGSFVEMNINGMDTLEIAYKVILFFFNQEYKDEFQIR